MHLLMSIMSCANASSYHSMFLEDSIYTSAGMIAFFFLSTGKWKPIKHTCTHSEVWLFPLFHQTNTTKHRACCQWFPKFMIIRRSDKFAKTMQYKLLPPILLCWRIYPFNDYSCNRHKPKRFCSWSQ